MRSRVDNKKLSAAIVGIYDAALDWGEWPAALNQIADLLGASTAQLGSYDAASHRLEMVMPRIDPDYAKSFLEYWAARNVLWQQSGAVPIGQVMRPEMFLPHGAWQRTDFFNEWYRPQKLDSMLGVNVLAEHPVSTVISTSRKAEFTAAETELLALLVPHVRRAVQLQLQLAGVADFRDASTEILNRLRQAVLLADELGKVYFANRSAEQIVEDGTGLRIVNGTLHAAGNDEDSTLQKALAACVATATAGAAPASRRIRMSRPGRRPLSVLMIPLRPQAPWARLYRPSVILFISDPERKVPLRSAFLREEYGLTRAEAALALEILAGHGLHAAAERLHISISTARTHLASIFRKTGTRRQAELVRTILQNSSITDE